MSESEYVAPSGVRVRRVAVDLPVAGAIDPIVQALDSHKGVLLASSYEYPGRYTRWDIGFVDPPIELVARGRTFRISALNDRGRVLLPLIARAVATAPAVVAYTVSDTTLAGEVQEPDGRFPEELRSKQPSIFSVIRTIIDLFHWPEEPHLGLYGAFGYDLAFQFEPLKLRLDRPDSQRDLVLYLPDSMIAVDHRRERATRFDYDFAVGDATTSGLARAGSIDPFVEAADTAGCCDHEPGQYASVVYAARDAFKRGDLFEVVPGQTFYEPCLDTPSTIFARLRNRNPAPYGFLINLGDGEYLVGASPEMYVRVEGDRVETCPISGTIARGHDPIGDAAQILELLNSAKDESELTMCTDVDRNDKSRICRPGSVRVIGRRQIEMYSRVIHTVDHVEGHLRDGFDALDAFLAHTWAVTVTGAPKAWAMQFIEDHEQSPRGWYGGAVGLLGFDGSMNTGLTLRTIRIKDGVAQVRAGATLLYDSDPDAEERETRVKASALLDAIRRADGSALDASPLSAPGAHKRILLVDHQDSFVHTLANYLRQTGADVVTLRAGFPIGELDELEPDLLVLSPGPGRPADFDIASTLAAALEREIPIFGVCLGLQGIVEYFGGELGILDYPMHGKPSCVRLENAGVFEGMPAELSVGRYHSLYALPGTLPAELTVTGRSDDDVIMAIEHRELPVAAVQFHPESILTLEGDLGLRLIHNVVAHLTKR